MKTHSTHDYPIKDYAIIGNCETAALINPNGGVDWLCLPAFDSPSFFGALLDREKGAEFSIRPGCTYRVEREYVDDSAILKTRFLTKKGTVQLTDFFVIARQHNSRFYDFTSLHPTQKLVRILKLESGNHVPIEVTVEARPEYGRHRTSWTRLSDSSLQYSCPMVRFYSNIAMRDKGDQLAGHFIAESDQTYFTVLD